MLFYIIDEDEPGLPFTSSRRNTPILNQAARDAKRSGSPPPSVEGKKGLAGIVGKSKFGTLGSLSRELVLATAIIIIVCRGFISNNTEVE